VANFPPLRVANVTRDHGLSGVLVYEQQVDAMRFCMSNKESEPGVEPDVEPDHVTDSDGEEQAARV